MFRYPTPITPSIIPKSIHKMDASKCMYLSFILLFKFSLFVYVVDQASDIELDYILSQTKSNDDHCAIWPQFDMCASNNSHALSMLPQFAILSTREVPTTTSQNSFTLVL